MLFYRNRSRKGLAEKTYYRVTLLRDSKFHAPRLVEMRLNLTYVNWDRKYLTGDRSWPISLLYELSNWILVTTLKRSLQLINPI